MKTNNLEGFRKQIQDYFCILSEETPDFLVDYIQTPEMQRLKGSSIFCGTDHTPIFHNKFYYSTFEHSIGVALIIWNFTKDKKQTIAGLFHDIATPSFKHCIDFLHQDYEKQESTEELTTKIIQNSVEIQNLLKRDGLSIEEVKDYKIYPIADNETPKLSADRLEYTFANGMSFCPIFELDDIRKIYQDITILKNEEHIPELGFKTLKIAEDFILCISNMWPEWISNRDKLVMQFWADIIKEMIEAKYLTEQELYKISEQQVIEKIKNHSNEKIASRFNKFQNTKSIQESEELIPNQYCVSVSSKRRYIVPLVKMGEKNRRINQVSEKAKKAIELYLDYQTAKYVAIDI